MFFEGNFMESKLPSSFTHKYLCRGCVQRDAVKDDGGAFIVNCCGEDVPAILKSAYPCFKRCPRHKTHPSNLGRPVVSKEHLQAINAYAVGLGTIDPVEKISLVAAFEAQLVTKA